MHRLHEYIKDGKPIYVRNLSGGHQDNITKLIILEIKPLNGPPRTIKIPPVDPPINLSAMVSPPFILGESQDLLDYINNEVLELVDPAEAQEELKDERAQRIVQKALRDIHSRTAFDPRQRSKGSSTDGHHKVPDRGRSEMDMSGKSNPLQKMMRAAADDIDYEPGEIKLSPADQEVSPVILEMCATMVADPSMAKNILEDLDAIPDSDVSDADLGHLIKHSMIKKISEWAQQRLIERGVDDDGGDDDEDSDEVRAPSPRSKKGRSSGRKKRRR